MKKITFLLTSLLFFPLAFSQKMQQKNKQKPIESPIYVPFQGDFADPSIVRNGKDFYLTHTSYAYYPGLEIWHSTDLKNWKPICRALRTNVGEVWAPEMIIYNNKYYIYFPTDKGANYLITADKPEGPWSEPLRLDIAGIDPGHISTPDGQRFIYVNGGRMSPLSPDGMRTTEPEKNVYEGWQYPADWAVECYCLESPKLFKRNDYYYMVSAQGGTSGPSTSHMAIVARSNSPVGPWKNSPYNPLIHTFSTEEPWVSKGHATLFDDANGNWWAVYHSYKNNHLPSGRNTLIEPVIWTNDEWPKVLGNKSGIANYRVFKNIQTENDDFSRETLKLQWFFGGLDSLSQYRLKDNSLQLTCSPQNFRSLICQPADKNYEVSIQFATTGDIELGLTAFYNQRIFTGISFHNSNIQAYQKGQKAWSKIATTKCNYLKFRIINYNIQLFWSDDGTNWTAYPEAFDLSGYHTNMLGNFSNLKIGIIGKGNGLLKIEQFNYKSLETIEYINYSNK